MIYTLPLIRKIIKKPQEAKRVEAFQSDEVIVQELLKHVSFDQLSDAFQRFYGVSFVNLESKSINQSILNIFDAEILHTYDVLPYQYDETSQTYYFVINDVFNEGLRQSIIHSCEKHNAKARFGFGLKSHIDAKYQQLKAEKERKESLEEETALDSSVIDGDFNAQVWVDKVLDDGIRFGASDIHIETLENGLQLRYRIDGVMTRKKVFDYPAGIISNIMVRVKVISGMDISEKRKPQDGRIDNYTHKAGTVDVRVSTVKTIHGEKVVMRLLNKTSEVLTFKQLGFIPEDEEKVKRLLQSKNGIVYIAGATGSGKTTTLYTMVDEVNDDSVNIYTIENPVEKTIENINQIQINPEAGVTYPSTLRALLRQDPDIIVVGEIRDQETAELSVQASLTGHLVVSTIHANNAIHSISRLINMGVEPYLIVGSSLGFLSQRLARKLCDHCKMPQSELKPHEEHWVAYYEAHYGVKLDRSTLHRPVGCDHCTNGYKGRVAIEEVVEMTDSLKELVLKGASSRDIEKQAMAEGFKPLVVNGLAKAQEGFTTIEELIKELS